MTRINITPSPADLIEVYLEKEPAVDAAKEWRDSARTSSVRRTTRTVTAFGKTETVHVVAVWWTSTSKVMGWDK